MQFLENTCFQKGKKKAAIGTILLRNRYDLLFFFYYGVQNSPHLATLFQNQNKLLFKTLSFDKFFRKLFKNFVKLQWENIKENGRDLVKRKRRKNVVDPHLQNQGSTKNHLRKSRKNQRNPKIPCHRLTI